MPKDVGKHEDDSDENKIPNNTGYRPYARLANSSSKQEIIRHGHHSLSIGIQNMLDKVENKAQNITQKMNSLDIKDTNTDISGTDVSDKIKSKSLFEKGNSTVSDSDQLKTSTSEEQTSYEMTLTIKKAIHKEIAKDIQQKLRAIMTSNWQQGVRTITPKEVADVITRVAREQLVGLTTASSSEYAGIISAQDEPKQLETAMRQAIAKIMLSNATWQRSSALNIASTLKESPHIHIEGDVTHFVTGVLSHMGENTRVEESLPISPFNPETVASPNVSWNQLEQPQGENFSSYRQYSQVEASVSHGLKEELNFDYSNLVAKIGDNMFGFKNVINGLEKMQKEQNISDEVTGVSQFKRLYELAAAFQASVKQFQADRSEQNRQSMSSKWLTLKEEPLKNAAVYHRDSFLREIALMQHSWDPDIFAPQNPR